MRWAVVPAVTIMAIVAAAVSARPRTPSVHGAESHESMPGVGTGTAGESALLRCGNILCDARRDYCETLNTDVRSLPTTYACRARPASCLGQRDGRGLSCDCFPSGTRCDFCTVLHATGTEAIYRTCIGGR